MEGVECRVHEGKWELGPYTFEAKFNKASHIFIPELSHFGKAQIYNLIIITIIDIIYIYEI